MAIDPKKAAFIDKFLGFFQESINRLSQESPAYAKVWQKVGFVLVFISFLPDLIALAELEKYIPLIWLEKIDGLVRVGGIATYIFNKLPVKNSTAIVTNPNTAQKTLLVKEELPYTAAVETSKSVKDNTVPVDVVPGSFIDNETK